MCHMATDPKLNLPVELVLHDCISCGVRFAMPKHLEDRRRQDHQGFFCPNGHSAIYTGLNKDDAIKDFRAALTRISQLDVGVILNKHSLELAIELAKTALEKHK